MAIAIDKPTSKWGNFALWSAIGAIFSAIMLVGISFVVNGDGPAALVRSNVVVPIGLVVTLSALILGLSMRNAPVSPHRLRNYFIMSLAALGVFGLVALGFQTFVGADALRQLERSELVAAGLGGFLIFYGLVGGLNVASAHTRANLIENEMTADDMRERSRMYFYSLVWVVLWGLLLIGLSLAGPGGMLPQGVALAGALVLITVLALLFIPVWRLIDELGRTLSYESGNIAFYLILVLGGGWAMLAHLGFVAAPAPLDWVTLLTVMMFAASVIAAGRRKLLTR